MSKPASPTLGRLAALGLWLGVVGFGGGYAVAHRIRRAVVHEHRWMSDAELLECLSVATALPGTAATHLLTLVGLKMRGWRGALLAAAAFLAPSFALMLVFAVVYDRLRGLQALSAALDGMGVATVGVVAAVAIELARAPGRRLRDWVLTLLALVLLATHLIGLAPLVVAAAVFGAVFLRKTHERDAGDSPFGPESMRAVAFGAPLTLAATTGLFIVFAKIGLVTFGGGFAMIPALEREAVQEHGWLSVGEFNDAMVLGQVTPGPVAIAATFIGVRANGVLGGVVATLGMFGPPFVLALLAGRSLERFRDHPALRGALDAIAPVVVGVIAASAIALWRSNVHDVRGAIFAAAACGTLVVFRRSSPLVPLILAGAVEVVLGRH